jgi:hypothetical protein
VTALISKPGITRLAVSSGIPKDWSQSWFRDFASDYLKGADVRNAVGANGIKISGNITSPYATIGVQSTFQVPNSAGTIGFDVFVNPIITTPPVMGNWTGGVGTQATAAIDLGNCSIMAYGNTVDSANLYVMANLYYNGANYIYKATGFANLMYQPGTSGGNFGWYTVPSGAGGTVATVTLYMQLNNGGGLQILAPATNVTALAVTSNSAANAVAISFAGSGPKLQMTNTAAGGRTYNIIPEATGSANAGWTLNDATGGYQVLQFAGAGNVYFPKHATTASAANAFINSGSSPVGELLRSTSSLRYKTNIVSLGPTDYRALMQMRPVQYTSLCATDDPKQLHLGLIAEEIAQIDQRLIEWSPDPVTGMPRPESVQYIKIVPLLVGLIQNLVARVAALEQPKVSTS